ncbi:hypothetical protein QCA50_010136 [Cerrena zonata]|uniref:DASH complex subunit ASK1 n=1 Tax=Cerrena zonata TaxID=2478898 RepID=A0AAW0GA97_9APHY
MASLKPIEPKPARWEPTPDPNDIVIPGLDTTAPVNEQIEQIEQLITIKLQNIDANFSKIQQIMANRILPAVKRYAVGTEPIRDAAKFWTTFFEQAAQIRVPTYEDYSTHEDQQTETETSGPSEHSDTQSGEATTPTQSATFNPDGTSTEVSFMPGQAAISSTPAASRHRSMRSQDFSHLSDTTPSWASSLESPLVRLDREIQSLGQDDAVSVASTSMGQFTILDDPSGVYDEEVTERPKPTEDNTFLPQSEKSRGKARETPQPLLRNILQRNIGTADSSNATGRSSVSPLKLKPKTPILKNLNPYLPPSADPSRWTGVVDLQDPSIRSPAKAEPSPAKHQRFTFHPPPTTTNASFKRPLTPKRIKTGHDADDDSFDEGFGMSPPITTDWARLPKLGQTPRKEAAERIMNKLLDVERRSVFSAGAGSNTQRNPPRGPTGTTESSLSSMPTPPSLSRYARPAETSSSMVDASLESLMHRVGTGFDYGRATESAVPSSTSSHSASAAYRSSEAPQPSLSSHSVYSQPAAAAPRTPEYPQYDLRHLKDDELQPPGSLDNDSDSLDDEEFNDPAATAAAFVLERASYDEDDSSFESNQDSFDVDGLPEGHEPVHPFARAQAYQGMDDDSFDDSFDDDLYDRQANTESTQEETVFGVPPAQRLLMQAQEEERRRQQFRLMGEHLLEDTMGIGAQMASQGRVEETPTPWMGGRGA